MGDSLRGARVALLEARRESELASLVRRHGGEPVSVPALREVERDFRAELARACEVLSVSVGPVVVLTTGTGLERVLRIAEGMGLGPSLRAALERSTVVCRGPKPIAVLKREGLPVHVRANPPHTTTELIAALAGTPAKDRDAVLVQDGGSGRAVAELLAQQGARVLEVHPYVWALPEDTAPLQALVRELVEGRVDAVAVTTQVQARHLFQIAASMAASDALREALRQRVVVAAVGPTSARALAELGAPAHVVPKQSSMGALVVALAERLSSGGPTPAT
jgi:uroporphyrinogen-III synthase